ncbi:tail component of prophage CP-933X [Escherichia coli]|nr:tail component of prophage CP-933X [Escherichia coli]
MLAQLQRSGDEAGALQAANEAATKGFDDQTRRLKRTWARWRPGQTGQRGPSNPCGMRCWILVVLIPRREMLIKAEAAFKKADDIWNLRKDDYFVNDEARARYWDES